MLLTATSHKFRRRSWRRIVNLFVFLHFFPRGSVTAHAYIYLEGTWSLEPWTLQAMSLVAQVHKHMDTWKVSTLLVFVDIIFFECVCKMPHPFSNAEKFRNFLKKRHREDMICLLTAEDPTLHYPFIIEWESIIWIWFLYFARYAIRTLTFTWYIYPWTANVISTCLVKIFT